MSAFVTGAGGALGGAIARRLAADGFDVAVVDIDEESAKGTARKIEASGGTALAFACDVRDETAIESTFEGAEERLGTVKALVNNAAIFPSGRSSMSSSRPSTTRLP